MSQPGTWFSQSYSATSAPSTYCPGYAPCVVYPAGSIVPPATIPLEVTQLSGGVWTTIGLAHCGDALAAYGETTDGAISSTAIALTVPACTTGGGIGSGGGGRPPGPRPM